MVWLSGGSACVLLYYNEVWVHTDVDRMCSHLVSWLIFRVHRLRLKSTGKISLRLGPQMELE